MYILYIVHGNLWKVLRNPLSVFIAAEEVLEIIFISKSVIQIFIKKQIVYIFIVKELFVT